MEKRGGERGERLQHPAKQREEISDGVGGRIREAAALDGRKVVVEVRHTDAEQDIEDEGEARSDPVEAEDAGGRPERQRGLEEELHLLGAGIPDSNDCEVPVSRFYRQVAVSTGDVEQSAHQLVPVKARITREAGEW